MYYVADWQWHLKSTYQSDSLKSFMLILNPWRMSLIFLVSGMAISLVEPKISGIQLLKLRSIRVFVPLLIGMYIIVPPQLYFELASKEGFSDSYLSFIHFYIDIDTEKYPHHQHGDLGLLTWNHLWYLAYLFCYTLIYITLKPILTRIPWDSFPKKPLPIFFALTSLLILYKTLLAPDYPQTYALAGDWYSHALYFTMFIFGYVLAKKKDIWDSIIRRRRRLLAIAIIHGALLLMFVHWSVESWLENSGLTPTVKNLMITWVTSIYTVASVFAAVAYAGTYLNKPSKTLHYINEAILPWYILHQTVIIFLAVTLSRHTLGPMLEPLILIVITFFICALLYEFIKRFRITRFIFGMKLASSPSSDTHT